MAKTEGAKLLAGAKKGFPKEAFCIIYKETTSSS